MRTISGRQGERLFGKAYLFKSRLDGSIRTADHHESIDAVLHRIDAQLQAFGLEIVQHETGSDEYAWHIQQRKGK